MQDAFSQLESAGLQIKKDKIEYGKIIRCRVDEDKGSKKSGWYVLREMNLRNGGTVLVGRYGNWSRYGDQVLSIELDLPPLSDEEKREFARQQIDIRKAADQERLQREREAARRALKLWNDLPDSGASPYLDRKQVRGFGLRFTKGAIAIPVRKIDGALAGLQFIQPDGEKKILTGTAKKGGFHVIGNLRTSGPIGFAEGYATAASGHMATDWPIVIVFDAYNLITVAKIIREHFPKNHFIFLGDNDIDKPGWACHDCGHISLKNAENYTEFMPCPRCKSADCKVSNTGVAKATAAARITHGVMFLPDFSQLPKSEDQPCP